jgi:hypothetical protein
MGILRSVQKSVHDLTVDPDEPTVPEGISDPPAALCQPVLVERARRKSVDEAIDRRLRALGRQTSVTMWAVLSMVAFAGLEYFGILGNSKPPTWAAAVLEGIAFAMGK